MRTTGFIRTATRWRSYSCIALAGVVAACASGTVRVYEPPQTAARISLPEMHDRLMELMVVECPRIIGTRDRRHGSVSVGLALDASGRVERASIRKGSGDAKFDDLAGGLAARLKLPPPPHVLANDPSTRLTVLYECSTTGMDIRLEADSV